MNSQLIKPEEAEEEGEQLTVVSSRWQGGKRFAIVGSLVSSRWQRLASVGSRFQQLVAACSHLTPLAAVGSRWLSGSFLGILWSFGDRPTDLAKGKTCLKTTLLQKSLFC